MKKYFLFIFLCLLMLMPGAAAYSQAPTVPGLIQLQAATFDPLVNGEPMQAANGSMSASPYYLVQFNGPVTAIWLQQVAALGGQVLGYIPDNTHVVRMDSATWENVKQLPAVRWVGPYRPSYKVAPALAALINDTVASASANEIEVNVVAFAGESPTALATFLQKLGATLESSGQPPFGPLFQIRTTVASLPTILQNPAISWVEPYSEPKLFNDQARKLMGGEAVWQDFGFYGAGQIIAIGDSGLSVQGALSADFNGRLLKAFSPSEMNLTATCRSKTTWTDLNGHGTHVAGSVLGNGALSGSNAANHQYGNSRAGLAPEAQLVFMALNTDGSGSIQCIDPNGDFLNKGYLEGARIDSNSWGANDQGGYNVIASLVDDYLWRHKDYLVLFAAGNAGPNAQTVGSPGTAKNVLTVGASENNRPDRGDLADNPDTMAFFSSRGPTQDGRIKPDVVAPGTWILSVRAAQAPGDNFQEVFDDNYAFDSGTSMATPLTAGASALVREWLAKQRGITNPSAALLKALMINGATQLPDAITPNNNTGHGRVDLKNTLNSQYAILDDHVQGLNTGQTVTYSVQIVGVTAAGTLFASDATPRAATAAVQAAAAQTLHVTDAAPPVAASQSITNPAALSVEPLPRYASARPLTPIPSSSSATKNNAPQVTNVAPTPPLTKTRVISGTASPAFRPGPKPSGPTTQTFLQGMIGGGDFEDPDWTDIWQYIWLGSGQPLRTEDPDFVISGDASMWLGGSPSDDTLWYPVQFPTQIDTSITSYLEFNIGIIDQDLGHDQFCVALVDASGNFIGPYAPDQPECVAKNGFYTYRHDFTDAELQDLAGQTGYLVLYNEGDGSTPHLSAFLDDVDLAVDFPDVTLEATPSSGPPGTTFLLTGHYNAPYGAVDICLRPCATPGNYIKTVYADAYGDIAAFVHSSSTINPGVYPIQTENVFGRTANTTLTIGDDSAPILTVTPKSGPAGTTFVFSGSGFLPNDNQIAATLNGEAFGTVGSNADGKVGFKITTQSNTPADVYQLELTDSANRSATANFTVIAPQTGEPTVVVTPTSGPPGTTFQFIASNFAPTTTADVTLDGQVIGQAKTNAAGGLQLTLETKSDTAPGAYTLAVVQGEKQAAAQYTVTGTGGGNEPPSGNSLSLSLVWTDPPAQSAAAQLLVNDLDLIVDGPDGRTFGNGGNTANRKDNVETIRLPDPKAGAYVITVAANRVNGAFGSQPYALVATTKQNAAAQTNNVVLTGPSGQVLSGTISGLVFIDFNRNGQQETAEPGLAKAQVTLRQVNGTLTKQTVTDSTGAYAISQLPYGNYAITIVLPAGYSFVTPSTGTITLSTANTSGQAVGAVVNVYMPFVQR